MSAHLQRAIDKLMEELIGLSAKVEESLKKAMQSLEERDVELARQVIEEDEAIDQKEIDIEEECLKIFALHQPVAIDLRYLVAVLKINNDLERIGDLAQNISKHAIRIVSHPVVIKPVDLQEIYDEVRLMVKQSLDAIVNMDIDAAGGVMNKDNEVDRLNRELYHKILDQIKENTSEAEILLQYIHIIRHLERIADHATNIAEDVIYLISGQIVRHGNTDD